MRILIDAGRMLLNFLLYGFGFLLGARVLYSGHERPVLMCAAFLLASVLIGFWSKWWAVVIPAGLGFLWGTGALKWAIHLTDTRGEYAPPMSQYIFNPAKSEAIWSFVAAGAAGIGWWISALLRSRRRIGPADAPPVRQKAQTPTPPMNWQPNLPVRQVNLFARPTWPVLVLPALHLSVCAFIQFHPIDRSYQWFPMFIVDLPISVPLLFLGRLLPAFVVFGVIGTLWWYLVGAVIRHLYWKYESKPQ